MPPKGHKSVTIPDELYDKLWQKWQKSKDELKRKGVNSFSSFVSQYLWRVMDELDDPELQAQFEEVMRRYEKLKRDLSDEKKTG